MPKVGFTSKAFTENVDKEGKITLTHYSHLVIFLKLTLIIRLLTDTSLLRRVFGV